MTDTQNEAPQLFKPVPAIFGHALDVYKKMYEESRVVTIDDIEVRVWEGFLTKLLSNLRLSTPYYSQVTHVLKAMDCIRQVRRGGGSSKSVWALVQEPTMALFDTIEPDGRKAKSEDKYKQALLEMQAQIDRLYAFTGCPRG